MNIEDGERWGRRRDGEREEAEEIEDVRKGKRRIDLYERGRGENREEVDEEVEEEVVGDSEEDEGPSPQNARGRSSSRPQSKGLESHSRVSEAEQLERHYEKASGRARTPGPPTTRPGDSGSLPLVSNGYIADSSAESDFTD